MRVATRVGLTEPPPASRFGGEGAAVAERLREMSVRYADQVQADDIANVLG